MLGTKRPNVSTVFACKVDKPLGAAEEGIGSAKVKEAVGVGRITLDESAKILGVEKNATLEAILEVVLHVKAH